ncbi:MAG: hypothetical protein K940chlam5_00259 [Candidatus Anoxychlamydiales bacterium]|nr:hypothetical protein [Candidatus Anoxychlamydiales bacterium]
MYRVLFCLFILSISSIKAENSNCRPDSIPKKCSPEPVPCCRIPAEPTAAAYNAPARIDVCGSKDAYLTLSFIYWKLEENIFVAQFQADGTTVNNDRTALTTMDYDYKPGFKIGGGYNFQYDDWNAYIEYTRYHATNSVSRTKPSWAQSMQPIYNRLTNTSGDEIDLKLKLEYDFIDLDLSRWQYAGQKILIKPFMGMHGGWLDQRIISDFKINSLSATNNSIYTLKQWMIGPRIGFFYKWKLLDYLSITGKGSTALLYQKFTKIFLRQTDQDLATAAPATLTTTESKRSSVNRLFELMLGFEYDKYFYQNRYHFNCLAGYDLHGLVSPILPPGWLALHGLTLSAQLDF